jgi:hypothetical protein
MNDDGVYVSHGLELYQFLSATAGTRMSVNLYFRRSIVASFDFCVGANRCTVQHGPTDEKTNEQVCFLQAKTNNVSVLINLRRNTSTARGQLRTISFTVDRSVVASLLVNELATNSLVSSSMQLDS